MLKLHLYVAHIETGIYFLPLVCSLFLVYRSEKPRHAKEMEKGLIGVGGNLNTNVYN